MFDCKSLEALHDEQTSYFVCFKLHKAFQKDYSLQKCPFSFPSLYYVKCKLNLHAVSACLKLSPAQLDEAARKNQNINL